MSPGPKLVASSGQALHAALLPCPQPHALHGFRGPSEPQNCPSPGLGGLHLGQDKAWQTTPCCTRPRMSDAGCHLQLWDMSAEMTVSGSWPPTADKLQGLLHLVLQGLLLDWWEGMQHSSVFPLRGILHSSQLIPHPAPRPAAPRGELVQPAAHWLQQPRATSCQRTCAPCRADLPEWPHAVQSLLAPWPAALGCQGLLCGAEWLQDPSSILQGPQRGAVGS